MEDKKRYELGFRYRVGLKFYKTEDEIKELTGVKWNLRKDGSLDAYEMINGNSLSKERIEKLDFAANKHAEALKLLSGNAYLDEGAWPIDNLTEEQCKIIVEAFKSSTPFVTPPYIKKMMDEAERFEKDVKDNNIMNEDYEEFRTFMIMDASLMTQIMCEYIYASRGCSYRTVREWMMNNAIYYRGACMENEIENCLNDLIERNIVARKTKWGFNNHSDRRVAFGVFSGVGEDKNKRCDFLRKLAHGRKKGFLAREEREIDAIQRMDRNETNN